MTMRALDPSTGELTLGATDVRAGPRLTLDEFLASAAAARAKPLAGAIGNFFTTYVMTLPAGELGPAPMLVALLFHDSRLARVELMNASPEFGADEREWTDANERRRKLANERWLEQVAQVEAGRYPWGSLSSVHDSKAVASYLLLEYRRESRCPGCNAALDIQEILASADRYVAAVRAFTARCPRCGADMAARVVPGRLWLGYTYAAGDQHFSPEAEDWLSEITGVWEDAGALHVRVERDQGNPREYVIPAAASRPPGAPGAPGMVAAAPSPASAPRGRHLALRVAAVVQAVVATIAAVYVLAILADRRPLGGDGIMEGFRWSLVGSFSAVALGAGYGAYRAWRAARWWWLPLAAATIAAPILFFALAAR